MIESHCPNCHHLLHSPQEDSVRPTFCPHCSHRLAMPAPIGPEIGTSGAMGAGTWRTVRLGLGFVRVSTWVMLVAVLSSTVMSFLSPMIKPSAQDRFEAVSRSLETGMPIPEPGIGEQIIGVVESVVSCAAVAAMPVAFLLLWVGLGICLAVPREARARRFAVGSLSCAIVPFILLTIVLGVIVVMAAPTHGLEDHHANDYLLVVAIALSSVVVYFAIAGPVLLALFLRKVMRFLGHHELDGSVRAYLFFEGGFVVASVGLTALVVLLVLLDPTGRLQWISPYFMGAELLVAPILIFVHFFWLLRIIACARKIVSDEVLTTA